MKRQQVEKLFLYFKYLYILRIELQPPPSEGQSSTRGFFSIPSLRTQFIGVSLRAAAQEKKALRRILERIQRSFGMGKIYKHGKNSDYYRIAGLNNLSVLIKHLDTFPLLTRSSLRRTAL